MSDEDEFVPSVAVAFVLLTAALIAGAFASLDPDFDVTFGVEAWRRMGPVAAVAGAVLVGLVVASRPVAAAIGDVVATVVGWIPARARIPLVVAGAIAMFVAFPDVSLSGDGMASVGMTAARRVQPSNALTSWLHFAAAGLLGLEPVEAVRAVSWAAGAVGVAAGVALARALFDDGPRRTATALLLLTTGNAALFFGSIEVYAPVSAAVIAYLLVALRALRGTGSPRLPPLVLGLAFALHGSAGLLLPSLAWVAWHGGADRRDSALRVLRSAAWFALPVIATFVGLWFGTWRSSLPPSGPDRWGNFLGASGFGPLVPLTFGPADLGGQYALLDAEHALAVLTTLFVAAPVAWVLLAGRALSPRGPSPDRDALRFAIAALVPWIVYPCVWNVSYALRRDWDLFSPAGTLAAFLAAILVLRVRDDRLAAVRIGALCAFAFVPFVATNAGDAADRRTFAIGAAAALDAWPDVRGADAKAASVRRWDDATRRWDVSRSAALIDEGDALKRAGRDADAAAKYAEAAAVEPDNSVAVLCHGLALLRLGRRDEARARLTEALVTPHEPLRVVARHALGKMALDDGHPDEAIRQLTRALHECWWTAEARPTAMDLADAWRRIGRDDVAAEIVRAADERLRR